MKTLAPQGRERVWNHAHLNICRSGVLCIWRDATTSKLNPHLNHDSHSHHRPNQCSARPWVSHRSPMPVVTTVHISWSRGSRPRWIWEAWRGKVVWRGAVRTGIGSSPLSLGLLLARGAACEVVHRELSARFPKGMWTRV